MRLNRKTSFLLVIDIQSKLAPAIHGGRDITSRSAALIKTARLMGVPVFATEHCADRIGPLLEELRRLLDSNEILSKRQFCCTDEPYILKRLKQTGRCQAVVIGMEAHVCVLQAALGLAEHGFSTYFVGDASGSRHAADHAAAIERLRAERIRVVTTEMVIFEWLGDPDTEAFREALGIVKSL